MSTKAFQPIPTLDRLARRVRAPFADTRGATTAWAVFWTVGFAMVGGVAMDSTNAYTYKTRLQAVADASALAAAMEIGAKAKTGPERAENAARATAAAIALANENMPFDKHGQVIREQDVKFGKFLPDGSFQEMNPHSNAVEAVQIVAGRDGVRGDTIPTWMIKLAGQEDWSVSVSSSAIAVFGATSGWKGGGEGECTSANITSTGHLQTAANNEYEPGVCFHGAESVKTAGNDLIPPGVYVSSPDTANIDLGLPLKEGSDLPENIVVQAETKTPMLDAMAAGLFSEFWNALTPVVSTKMYTIGGLGPAQNYFGPQLPEFVFMDPPNVAGRANYRNNLNIPAAALRNFKFEDGDIKPHDVWQWVGDMNFKGNVSLNNVVLVVDGDVNFGGGSDVVMKDVFILATGEIKNAGNAQVGYQLSEFCDVGEYSVTLIAGDRITLGGNGNSGSTANESGGSSEEPIKGVFGAMIIAGGGLNAGGLYIEADEAKTDFAGNMHLRTCTTQLTSFLDAFTLDDVEEETQTAEAAPAE